MLRQDGTRSKQFKLGLQFRHLGPQHLHAAAHLCFQGLEPLPQHCQWIRVMLSSPVKSCCHRLPTCLIITCLKGQAPSNGQPCKVNIGEVVMPGQLSEQIWCTVE